jgi:hypothetical protein
MILKWSHCRRWSCRISCYQLHGSTRVQCSSLTPQNALISLMFVQWSTLKLPTSLMSTWSTARAFTSRWQPAATSALAYAGERACYQSVITSGSQLVLLGTKGIHVLVLRTWNERLELLLKQDRYSDALSLARSFYDGTAHCVVGLTGTVERRCLLIADKIMELLTQYVDLAMTRLCPSHGKMEELEAYYQVCIIHLQYRIISCVCSLALLG